MDLQLYPVLVPFIVAIITQTIKLVIDFFKTKSFHFHNLRSAGGFPSVHSAISSSVAMLVFLKYGINNMLFAVVCTFTFLFIYDAMNVRYEAGKHAHYINNLRVELKEVLHKHGAKFHLKERLGHTPFEVLGGVIFGLIITFLIYKYLPIW